MKILVTGSAGFIGFHLVKLLLERGEEVVGIDNINDYYDVGLKYGRLSNTGIASEKVGSGDVITSLSHGNYRFIKLDITNKQNLADLFKIESFDVVCHLAAQAGVRYSLTNPQAYLDSNIQGFLNVLECCRFNKIQHLIYASSSSVYGSNKQMPFSTHSNTDHPISLYAASKKSNELMAHAYSHLYGLPTTGLRLFTVYGTWGRPDMAIFLFTKAIIEGQPIQVFNNGQMKRDFTHVSDIVEGIMRVIYGPAKNNGFWNSLQPELVNLKAPYRVFNIGRGKPVSLLDFIYEIEKRVGKKAVMNFLPQQDGDVKETWADISDLISVFGYKPQVGIDQGISEFVNWYKEFYGRLPK